LLLSLNSCNSSNSFSRATRPYDGPFIGKTCPIADFQVIDVAGFSTACLAKSVLKFPVRYENQRTHSEAAIRPPDEDEYADNPAN
jgi:hypothetical protein